MNSPRQAKTTWSNALATVWGLAEATVFVIVPDVLLTWLALRGYRNALGACLFALGGALAGGTVIWIFGRSDPGQLRTLFAALPAISEGMIAEVRSQLVDGGLMALFVGPLTGTPYKVYALEAANLGYSLSSLLLISIPARLVRFVVVTVAAASMSQLLRRKLSLRHMQLAHMLCWIAFYAWYFSVMGDSNALASLYRSE